MFKLEQGAKTHLAQSFQVQLEEKDEQIKVLQTQIQILRTSEPDTATNVNF